MLSACTVKHFNLAAIKIDDCIQFNQFFFQFFSDANLKYLKFDIHARSALIDSQKSRNKEHTYINGFTVNLF